MGDLVLTEPELNPVMKSLAGSGIEVTAIHNHLLRAQPATMYMHVEGHGDPVQLARALRLALEQSETPVAFQPAPTGAAEQGPTSSTRPPSIASSAARARRTAASTSSRSRAPSRSRDGGMGVPPRWARASRSISSPPGRARRRATGDFVLTAEEVNPVLRALGEHGIEVTALHNHMLQEEPRLFFMHFWGVDDAGKLAEGLKAALGKVNVAKS